jgi:hypothetical protein
MKESIGIENAGAYNKLHELFKEQVDETGRPIHPDEKFDSFMDFLISLIIEQSKENKRLKNKLRSEEE